MGIAVLASTVSGLGATTTPAQATAEPYAVSTIDSFQAPGAVAMAPNGKILYVANSQPVGSGDYGSSSEFGISVVSTATNTIRQTIIAPSFDEPVALAVSPNGVYLYVLNYNGEVSVVSTSSDTVTATIGVRNDSSEASDIVISAAGTTGYISQEGLGVVSVLNLSTHLVTRTITVPGPTSLALSPAGQTLYAVNGTYGGTQIAVIDTAAGTVTDTINAAAQGLSGIALSPDGAELYAVDFNQVDVYATATDSLAAAITGLDVSYGNIVASPNGSALYVGGPASVSVIDTVGNADTVTTISISNDDGNVDSLAVTPTGTTVYALSSSGSPAPLTVINATSETVTGAVSSVGQDPTAVVPSPNGREVYVTNSDGVSVISTVTQTVTQFFYMSFQPAGIALSPNGETLFLTDDNDGTVSVLNAATGAVTDTINLGGAPAGVAFAPNGRTAYVTNSSDNTVEVIDIATGFPINTISVTNSPTSVVVSPDGKTVYAGGLEGLAVINAATDTVSASLSVEAGQLALSPDGKTLYASYAYYLSVISTANDTIVKALTSADWLDALALSPDGRTLYATVEYSESVLAFSASTYVATTITEPSFSASLEGIAVTPNGKAVYVADYADGSVHVLTHKPVASKITSRAAATFTVGKRGTFKVTTSGYPAAATITESGTLPEGVTFTNGRNGTATLSGTPAAGTGKSYAITIKATNGVGAVASQSFKFTVDQAPAITSAAKATFTYRKKGSFDITASGYPAVATVTESGSLPKGVTCKNNKNGTATLSGTPMVDANKTYLITIRAANGVGPTATQKFQLILKKLEDAAAPTGTLRAALSDWDADGLTDPRP